MNSSAAPGETPELQCSELEVAFEVAEDALNALSSLSRTAVGFGSGEGADLVARVLVDEAGDRALPSGRAFRLERAPGAIGRAAAVAAHPACANGANVAERLVGRAAIRVGMRIVSERIAREEAVAMAGAVNDRHVGRDVLTDEPAKQRAIAVCLVGRKALGRDAQPVLRA